MVKCTTTPISIFLAQAGKRSHYSILIQIVLPELLFLGILFGKLR